MATDITLDQLTTKTIDGDGVFDGLMQAVSAHIQREYENNRIKGNDYSTVYLGALQSTLSEAVRFLLDKNSIALQQAQIDRLRAEIELLELKKNTELIQQDVLRKQQELYTSQAKSFPVDLEIKWRRLQYEYRIAQYTTNELGTEPVFTESIFDAKFPNN